MGTRHAILVLTLALVVTPNSAQLANFLSAFYGSTTTTTPKPPPQPLPQLRRRIERKNLDDAFGAPAPLGGQIITAAPVRLANNFASNNNIPLSGALQTNYISTSTGNPIGNPLLSSFPQPVVNSGGNGIGSGFASSASSFSSSPNDLGDSAWPLNQPDLPKITDIQVQCEKTAIRVSIEFDRPFFGMVFSKGHFSDQNCIHLQAGSGATSTVFEIQNNQCGMTSSSGFANDNGQPNPAGSFIESTIIVQYDPLVQEVFDQARKLRCTWYDYYEKSVTFRPFQVNMLNAVTANFLGDNLQCWMQIQSGKGPWSSEVSGIVKIGQTMTMVLGIKDEDNKFDMVVRNCVAHDGKRTPIQLVNELGCVIRPKIMSKFNKIKNFGSSATVVSYAYFQAFKFPDSMNVHFQCVIQVCRYNCPEPVCPDDSSLVQSSVTPAPLFGGSSDIIGTPAFGDSVAAPNSYGAAGIGTPLSGTLDSYAVDPRTPSQLAATRRKFRAHPATFNARQGRDNDANMFSFSDASSGTSSQHQYNNKHNPYYQSYQNHRVKRHQEQMEKSNDGAVDTNSTLMVLSPNDVAFRLSTSQNFNGSDPELVEDHNEWVPDHSICVTLTNPSGILFLSFMAIIILSLITSASITWRRCMLKRQKYAKKGSNKAQLIKTAPVPPKKLLEKGTSGQK